MTTVLFVHGWGFDASFWDDVIALLPNTTKTHCIDLGFTGTPDTTLPDDDRIICVGHSLGVMWLLKHIQNPAALIAINGFDNFVGHVGQSPIQAIKNNVQRNIVTQMQGFYKTCGVSARTLPNFNKFTLLNGLEWLKTWNASHDLSALLCPVIALLSRNDRVFPVKASEEIWNKYNVIWHQDGGHCLPITNPAFCADHIQREIDGSHT